ncbi:MAG TPA: four-carbon acid sugar kinase family protein [Galbitalea sp.]|nr:four-carbon acid sugar kinase family protein [Galbitalea sp.]
MNDYRAIIRDYRSLNERRTAVLDDDPTGSQSVHDVSVVTSVREADYLEAFADIGSTCFFLTNTRSMTPAAAVAEDETTGRAVFELEKRLGTPFDVVSRSDSTLRGHVIDEVRALDAVRREVLGGGFDGVLFVPAYLEAGRFTEGDVHYATVGGEPIPVGESEFARDATFGFSSSNLRDFVEEKSGGTIPLARVLSIGLDDIRDGGPDRVARILESAVDLQFIVVNAATYDDLDIVVVGLHQAQDRGKRFLHRTGPSFVQSLIGLAPRGPLSASEIWTSGRSAGHGLVVIGSHVQQTVRQMTIAQERGGVTRIELMVPHVIDASTRQAHLEAVARQVRDSLAYSDVMLFTSRALVTGADGAASLDLSRLVSTALTDVVRDVLTARPAWVIAKGGITSHDVAVRSLGIRRATVLGQLLHGMISVLRTERADEDVAGMPFVVFAGNVGGDDALANAIEVFDGRRASMLG